MAGVMTTKAEGFAPIDPRETFVPATRRLRRAESPLVPGDIVLGYDRSTDTLMVFLYGRDRPTESRFLGGSTFALADPVTDELLGFQIEDFLAVAVPEHPELIDLLEFAELRDFTPDEVRNERRRVLGMRDRVALWLRRQWRLRGVGREGKRVAFIAAVLRRQPLVPFAATGFASAC